MSQDVIPLPLAFVHPESEAIASVWWTGMLMKRAFRKAFGKQFRSEAQFNALRALALSDGPLTQNEIADKLLTDKANVSGLVDSLEAAGLARRKPVEGDRRSKHVFLTAKGRRLADEAGAAYLQKVREATTGLTKAEMAQLIGLTRKVREGLVGLLD